MDWSWRGGAVSRRVVAATAVALVPLVAGCAAGFGAPSLQWHQPSDGVGLVVGNVTISNAFLLGAPIGSRLEPGQNAGLFFGITNTGTRSETLVAISAPGVASSVLLPGGQVVVNSQHSVLLTGPRPAVVLQHLLRPVTGGSAVKLVLTFQNAGRHTLVVPVMPMAQYYSTLSPAPSVTPTPTITARPSPATSGGRSGNHHRRHRSPSPSASP